MGRGAFLPLLFEGPGAQGHNSLSVTLPNVDMFGACFVKQTFAICSGVVEGALNSFVVLALVHGAFCLAS